MMNKTFENVQQLGKEWSAYSRRVSRVALRAMSGQLETAARYLGSLSHRLDESDLGGEASKNGASASNGPHAESEHSARPSDSAN